MSYGIAAINSTTSFSAGKESKKKYGDRNEDKSIVKVNATPRAISGLI